MKLLTKEILEAFKKQGYTGSKKNEEIKVICKLFNPTGAGTWYCYEYIPEDNILWAFVNLVGPECAECGTVSVKELEELKTPPFGLGIERDMHFPIGKYTLREIIDKIKNGGHV